MADDRANIVEQTEVLEKAVRRKWNRYTWSGLVIILVGLIMIISGVALNTGAYSAEGLLIGFGALVVIAGIIRILIGVINPATPEDLLPFIPEPVSAGERASEEGNPLL
jgi:uncharacterized membrane protein HdeD (DUF308 family)